MSDRTRSALLTFALVLLAGGAVRADIDLFSTARPQPPPPAKRHRDEPSPVIYPEQRLPLKFSHARHLKAGATCVGCHVQAVTSVSSHDNLLPPESACLPCHAVDRQQPQKQAKGPKAACSACHIGDPADRPATLIPPPFLKFNHRLHAEAKIDCSRCHGDLGQVDLATRAQLPTMAVCLGCHREGPGRGQGEAGATALRRLPTARCAACHLQQGDGTLEVRFSSGLLVPSGELRGDDHGPNFRRDHSQVARSDPDYCASCHTQAWCQRCHNGVVKPFDIHGGDYVSRHGQDARRNQPDCSGCHRRQTFCLGCHERLGVTSHSTLPGSPSPSAFQPAAPRRFHAEGWASPAAGPNLHAQEAQRNMRSCVSCHREETCLGCHSTLPDSRVPGGVDPHPVDWISSGRCRALLSRNGRVCLKCHRDGTAALTCGG